MKLKHLFILPILGSALLTTSALACDHASSSSEESHWSFLGWCHHLVADSHRECDQNGQNSGRGNNCDHGQGNGGGYCGTGSSSSSSGSTSGSGSTGSAGSTSGGTTQYK